MSKQHYGFRTGRLPVRSHGIPWTAIVLAIAAAAAWWWVLSDSRDPEAIPTFSSSIPQTAISGQEGKATPLPQETKTLSTDAITLYVVQLSAHDTSSEAQEIMASNHAKDIPCFLWEQDGKFKVIDRVLTSSADAQARKDVLTSSNLDSYVYEWKVPALQADMTASSDEIILWEDSLQVLESLLSSSEWAEAPFSSYPCEGLSSQLVSLSERLRSSPSTENQTLSDLFLQCAQILQQADPMAIRTSQCAVHASSYITSVLPA